MDSLLKHCRAVAFCIWIFIFQEVLREDRAVGKDEDRLTGLAVDQICYKCLQISVSFEKGQWGMVSLFEMVTTPKLSLMSQREHEFSRNGL